MYFPPFYHKCSQPVYPFNILCLLAPPPAGGTHHNLAMVSSAEFDCRSRSDGYYPSPTSCSNYYICASHLAFRTDCHPGLLFNEQTLYCDFPDHVVCHAKTPVNQVCQP